MVGLYRAKIVCVSNAIRNPSKNAWFQMEKFKFVSSDIF
jgi:hypothetical protein